MAGLKCDETNARFPGEFRLEPEKGYSVSDEEKRLIACVAEQMDQMLVVAPNTDDLVAEMDALRFERAKAMLGLCKAFADIADPTDRVAQANRLVVKLWRLEGAHWYRRERLSFRPFKVRLEPEDQTKLATDLVIGTRDVPIPPEKQRLKLEIDKAATILKAALTTRKAASSGWRGMLNTYLRKLTGEPGASEKAVKLDDYLRHLAGTAGVGLVNMDRTQTPFAVEALESFKNEVVAREATHIKNSYVLRLGAAAAVAIALCMTLNSHTPALLVGYENFFLLWAGAAAGTWLSFSLRRPVLQFADLALLEEDRLRPEFRILFVLVLTTVVGLFFWTGMLSVDVGDFKTESIKSVGALRVPEVPVLIGMLCGIAERSMSGAVYRRAEDFASGVAGAKPSPTT